MLTGNKIQWPAFLRETAVLEKKTALGQYFTPPTVVEFMYEMLWCIMPEKDKQKPKLIDPACGEGVFLKFVLDTKITLPEQIYGVDIDENVKNKWSNLGLENKVNLYIQNGLIDNPEIEIIPENFDLVIGNPPFGGEGITELSKNEELMEKLKTFDLWQKTKIEESKTNPELFGLSSHQIKLKDEQIEKIEKTPIEILFLERFIQLAKPGKWIAIIIPDGILANSNLKYVRDWLSEKVQVFSIISLPRETFKHTGTTAKTSIMFMQKSKSGETPDKTKPIFSAISEFVGVNSKNDLPEIVEEFRKYLKKGKVTIGHHSPTFGSKHYIHDDRWDADYWDPKYEKIIREMKRNWKVKKLGQFIIFITYGTIVTGKDRKFVSSGICHINQVNVRNTGLDIYLEPRFISKSDLRNAEKSKPLKEDILFNRDQIGTIGRCFIFNYKTDNYAINDHVDIIRVKDINPYYAVIFLLSIYGKFQVERCSSGVSGIIGITFAHIKSIQIPLLPEKIQKKIELEYKEMSKWHDKAMAVK